MSTRACQSPLQVFVIGLTTVLIAFSLKYTIHYYIINPNIELYEFIAQKVKINFSFIAMSFFIVSIFPLFTLGCMEITKNSIEFKGKKYNLEEIKFIKRRFKDIKYLEMIVIYFENKAFIIDNYRYSVPEMQKIKLALQDLNEVKDKGYYK